MDTFIKDVLNRVGTKAVVTIIAMFFLFTLAMKDGLTVSPLWFAGGIVIITLAFYVIRYLTKDKEEILKVQNGGTDQ